SEASQTAVALPSANVPTLDYQDPLDRPRARITAEFKFYSFLDPSVPVHRALVRLSSGDQIAFERIMSWLDVNLKTTNFANTIGTTLSSWNTNTLTFNWSNNVFTAPRVVSQTVYVGQRLAAPPGETGTATGE